MQFVTYVYESAYNSVGGSRTTVYLLHRESEATKESLQNLVLLGNAIELRRYMEDMWISTRGEHAKLDRNSS